MVSRPLSPLTERYDAVLFDVGNTLVEQILPGVPTSSDGARLLDGVQAVFEVLTGQCRLGVVSNTTTMSGIDLRRHLQTVGLLEHLEIVVATADLGVHKPDPLPLAHALGELAVDPVRALYVGDNESDRVAAEAAGMDFCFTGPDLFAALARFAAHPRSAWERAASAMREPDPAYAADLRRHLDRLVKPVGALGDLEELACRLAAIQRRERPVADPCGAAVFCADHGIAADDHVTPWPQAISATMAGVIADGRAASAVLARIADVHLEVVDVGLAFDVPVDGVRAERVRHGTADVRLGDAMTPEDVRAALEVGAATAERLVAGGSRLLCVGEVGMGNTTVAAVLISTLCGVEPAAATGRGAGIDDATFERKRLLVSAVVSELADERDPWVLAARVGGLEIVAMAGFIVGAAALGVPVVLDGVTTQAAACLAHEFAPWSTLTCIAGHRSTEPASSRALAHLGLRPVLDLGMRLGEGTGALLAVPLLRAVCAAAADMATLDDIL